MKDKIVKYFWNISPLSVEEAEAIKESSVIKTFKKGTILLREGQYSSDTYFVFEGLIRQYQIIDGEEKTTAFFTEDQWIISLNGSDSNKPSNCYWVCDEDCLLLTGNDASAQALFDRFPRLEGIARKVIEHTFAEFQQKMLNYLNDSPEQRYLRLVEANPDLVQRIPQYQLASYIGVKPESLSRIRRRIMKKS